MKEANWGGPVYPNQTTAEDLIDKYSFRCSSRGCLFNVVNDTEERYEVSAEYPDVVDQLMQEMKIAEQSIWRAPHGKDPECKKAARELYGGFYGPWKELEIDN